MNKGKSYHHNSPWNWKTRVFYSNICSSYNNVQSKYAPEKLLLFDQSYNFNSFHLSKSSYVPFIILFSMCIVNCFVLYTLYTQLSLNWIEFVTLGSHSPILYISYTVLKWNTKDRHTTNDIKINSPVLLLNQLVWRIYPVLVVLLMKWNKKYDKKLEFKKKIESLSLYLSSFVCFLIP